MTATPRRPRRLAALLAAGLLCATLPAAAEDDPLAEAEDGLRRILGALELLISTIPQYAMPEVLENGDIIIRRLDPPAPPEDEADPDDANGDGVLETTT